MHVKQQQRPHAGAQIGDAKHSRWCGKETTTCQILFEIGLPVLVWRFVEEDDDIAVDEAN